MVVLFRIYEVCFKFIFDKILFLHSDTIRMSVLYVKGILPPCAGLSVCGADDCVSGITRICQGDVHCSEWGETF